MKDGLLGKCKKCTKTDALLHREDNIDKIRAYDRARGNRQKKGYCKEWASRGKNKRWAHGKVGNAIKNGSLIRSTNCETCDTECKTVGHHHDYLKPLDVEWLCQACHKQWHVKHGEGKNGNTER